MALKTFSIGPGPVVYRKLANRIGSRRRISKPIHPAYFSRSNLLYALLSRYKLMEDAERVLELGTGWMHWYGLMVRLAYDVRVDIYDVWDNRQLDALKHNLRDVLNQIDIPTERMPVAKDLVDRISAVRSWDELYTLIGSKYILNEHGSLSSIETATYDGLISFHVQEHIHRSSAPSTVSEYFRVLKPGGFSIHQIGIDDHLTHYDQKHAHKKQYISYEESIWRLIFSNRVQYFNRLQKSQWLQMFEAAGFSLVHVEQESCSLAGLRRIASPYKDLPRDDLNCTILTMVHQKPR